MLARLFAPLAMKVAAGIIALLAILLAVQTVRLEGLRIWPLHIEGWKPKAERLAADLENIKVAQGLAAEAAKAARLAAEARYRNLAENADVQIAQARDAALSAADRFIAANRVRPQAAYCPSSGTGTSAESRDPGLPSQVPADPLVAVGELDVRRCSEATAYAVKAHDWANSLEMETK